MDDRKEKEGADKHHTFKGTAKAVSLAAKLSPKTQRKKDKYDQVSQLKVFSHGLFMVHWEALRQICVLEM